MNIFTTARIQLAKALGIVLNSSNEKKAKKGTPIAANLYFKGHELICKVIDADKRRTLPYVPGYLAECLGVKSLVAMQLAMTNVYSYPEAMYIASVMKGDLKDLFMYNKKANPVDASYVLKNLKMFPKENVGALVDQCFATSGINPERRYCAKDSWMFNGEGNTINIFLTAPGQKTVPQLLAERGITDPVKVREIMWRGSSDLNAEAQEGHPGFPVKLMVMKAIRGCLDGVIYIIPRDGTPEGSAFLVRADLLDKGSIVKAACIASLLQAGTYPDDTKLPDGIDGFISQDNVKWGNLSEGTIIETVLVPVSDENHDQKLAYKVNVGWRTLGHWTTESDKAILDRVAKQAEREVASLNNPSDPEAALTEALNEEGTNAYFIAGRRVRHFFGMSTREERQQIYHEKMIRSRAFSCDRSVWASVVTTDVCILNDGVFATLGRGEFMATARYMDLAEKRKTIWQEEDGCWYTTHSRYPQTGYQSFMKMKFVGVIPGHDGLPLIYIHPLDAKYFGADSDDHMIGVPFRSTFTGGEEPSVTRPEKLDVMKMTAGELYVASALFRFGCGVASNTLNYCVAMIKGTLDNPNLTYIERNMLDKKLLEVTRVIGTDLDNKAQAVKKPFNSMSTVVLNVIKDEVTALCIESEVDLTNPIILQMQLMTGLYIGEKYISQADVRRQAITGLFGMSVPTQVDKRPMMTTRVRHSDFAAPIYKMADEVIKHLPGLYDENDADLRVYRVRHGMNVYPKSKVVFNHMDALNWISDVEKECLKIADITQHASIKDAFNDATTDGNRLLTALDAYCLVMRKVAILPECAERDLVLSRFNGLWLMSQIIDVKAGNIMVNGVAVKTE